MNSTIYTNMDSVRNYNIFNDNKSNASNAMTRVTTGLKIASAKDGASQYAISERMLERLNANTQASQNVQTDSALTRTASEGIANTIDILKTLRAKAIDAANDSNSASDRLTIQNDVDKLIAQVDYNANVVKFNGKALLDGSFDEKVAPEDGTVTAYALKMDTTQSGKTMQELLGITGSQTAQLIVSWANSTGAVSTQVVTDTIAASATLSSVMTTNVQAAVEDGEAGLLDSVAAVTEGTPTSVIDTGSGAINSPVTGFMAVSANEKEAGRFSGLTVKLVSLADSSKSVSYNFDTLIQRGKTQNLNDTPLAFQVGESSGMAINLNLGDMSAGASGLGISQLSVKTKDDATASIAVIDNALSVALKQQTDIGAMEERLGFTADTLDTINENLQASASAIRDSDMAKEVSDYMKWNVLMQASQYMLAQSNQNAFMALNLLQ